MQENAKKREKHEIELRPNCGSSRASGAFVSILLVCLLAVMSGFDANQVYTVSVHDVPAPIAPESASAAEKLLLEFILQFQVDGQFIYRSAASLPDLGARLLCLI